MTITKKSYFSFLKFIILFIIINSTNLITAQCPLDINEIPSVSNNGLVLYFPFNGNVQNYGSSTNTATLSGATYSNGICGQALHFDGFNDYVKVSPFIDMIGSYTISTWVYLDTLIYEQEIFTTREQCQTTYRRFSRAELALNHNQSSSQTDRLLYMINQNQNCTGYATGDRYEPPNIAYTDSSWIFLTVTIQNNNSENRIVEFYMDCQKLSSTMFLNTNTAFLFNSGYNYTTYIGGGPNIGSYHYSLQGKIDEFRLYNRILTQSEILDLYHKCRPLRISIDIGKSCYGDSATITLSNTQSGVKYRLFDSITQQYLGLAQNGSCGDIIFNTGLVTTPKNFYIKARDTVSSCVLVLDTTISLNPIFSSNSYYDTLYICKGDSTFINGGYYTAPNIVIDTIVNYSGCDSIEITTLLEKNVPNFDLGKDTILCSGDSILLSVNNIYSTYLWSTGSTQNSIYINTPGLYWLETSFDNCILHDTINVINSNSLNININDTVVCSTTTNLKISLPSNNTYLWFDGSSNSSIIIKDSGQYWVQIDNGCKVYNEDFKVNYIDCSCLITVPNAFTPNDDGKNDTFYPVISCVLEYYDLQIYNRWGKLIYQTYDQYSKWDGTYKNRSVPDGVYFYLLNYEISYLNGGRNQKTGSVTLLR